MVTASPWRRLSVLPLLLIAFTTAHADDDGGYAFPPLWGPQAYNGGAGMHRIETAAGFIKANMPLGKPNSLTDQQAWDLAAYINSHPRPPDPRSEQNLETHIKAYHGTRKRTPLGGLFGAIDPGR